VKAVYEITFSSKKLKELLAPVRDLNLPDEALIRFVCDSKTGTVDVEIENPPREPAL